jgi:hypothetical protein
MPVNTTTIDDRQPSNKFISDIYSAEKNERRPAFCYQSIGSLYNRYMHQGRTEGMATARTTYTRVPPLAKLRLETTEANISVLRNTIESTTHRLRRAGTILATGIALTVDLVGDYIPRPAQKYVAGEGTHYEWRRWVLAAMPMLLLIGGATLLLLSLPLSSATEVHQGSSSNLAAQHTSAMTSEPAANNPPNDTNDGDTVVSTRLSNTASGAAMTMPTAIAPNAGATSTISPVTDTITPVTGGMGGDTIIDTTGDSDTTDTTDNNPLQDILTTPLELLDPTSNSNLLNTLTSL